MTSRTAQFVRAYESVAADTSLADRWDALGEAIEQHGRDIDAFAEQVRAERAQREGDQLIALAGVRT